MALDSLIVEAISFMDTRFEKLLTFGICELFAEFR